MTSKSPLFPIWSSGKPLAKRSRYGKHHLSSSRGGANIPTSSFASIYPAIRTSAPGANH